MEVEKKGFPEGWKQVRLKDISSSIQYGYTESSSKKKVGPKFLRITDIQDGKVNWEDVPYCHIEDDVKSKYLLQSGDLVFARTGATVGKSFLLKGNVPEAVFASYLIRVRVNEQLNDKYLSYFFNSPAYWSQITEGQVGIGQPNVNGTKLGQLHIILAPLDEQERIVAKIEELFSEMEAGKAALERASQGLKLYRQAVLKWAFESEKERYKSCLLSEVSEKIQIGPFGTQLHREDYIEGGIPLINPMHIVDGKVKADSSYTISPEKRDSLANYILKQGDVIMGRRGEMGRCGLITEKEEGWFCGTGSLYFRPKHGLVDSTYLFLYLGSDTSKKYLEANAGGTTMANLNLKIVNSIPLPLPPLEEQHRIVQEIESRLSVCDKIEATITASMQQAEALRQSILKKAFEGKLVTAVAPAKIIALPPVPKEYPERRKAFACRIIFLYHDRPTFGLTMFQKMLHLHENVAAVDYETYYSQQRAGPMDEFIYALKEEAEEKGWFTTHETESGFTRLHPGPSFHALLHDHIGWLRTYAVQLKKVGALLEEVETLHDAELYSTVYAVWNNCLIQELEPTPERIVQDFYAWSDEKQKYSGSEIKDALITLEDLGLAPVGFGKEIAKS